MTHPTHTLTQVMEELEKLRAQADAAFARVAAEFPQAVTCHLGCDDCCHALFDLTPVESLALAQAFSDLPRQTRREIQRQAQKSAEIFDRTISQAFSESGQDRIDILSRARIPCPLLLKGQCALYPQRPLTCRLYGIPAAIDGQARICHKTLFQPGQTYPTVDMTKVQNELERLSGIALRLIPSLTYARRDMARSLELANSHGPLLRALFK
ncbi:MAG: YkgJ family cysteine cluster protein [Desulfarculaceae bacterium]|jgi:Fe-S-cluster containining protein